MDFKSKDSPKQGKKENSELVWSSNYFEIFQEKHRLSNGDSHNFYVVDAPNWVSIVPIDEQENFVMVSQYRAAWQRNSLEFPAGRLDSETETFLQAAKREFEEETGLIAENWNSIGRARPVTWTNQEVNFFLATQLSQGLKNPDPEEDIELVRIPSGDFMKYVKNNEIVDIPSISAYYFWKLYHS